MVSLEHTLCEIHKYARALSGGCATRARFVPNATPLVATPVLQRAWEDPVRKAVRIWPTGTRERAHKRYLVAQLLEKRKAMRKSISSTGLRMRRKIVPGSMFGCY